MRLTSEFDAVGTYDELRIPFPGVDVLARREIGRVRVDYFRQMPAPYGTTAALCTDGGTAPILLIFVRPGTQERLTIRGLYVTSSSHTVAATPRLAALFAQPNQGGAVEVSDVTSTPVVIPRFDNQNALAPPTSDLRIASAILGIVFDWRWAENTGVWFAMGMLL